MLPTGARPQKLSQRFCRPELPMRSLALAVLSQALALVYMATMTASPTRMARISTTIISSMRVNPAALLRKRSLLQPGGRELLSKVLRRLEVVISATCCNPCQQNPVTRLSKGTTNRQRTHAHRYSISGDSTEVKCNEGTVCVIK